MTNALCAMVLTAGACGGGGAPALRWVTQIGGNGTDTPASLAARDGSVVAVVNTQGSDLNGQPNPARQPIAVVKYGEDGTARWTRFVAAGGDEGWGVSIAPDGSVYVVGESNGFGGTASAGANDLMLVKLNPDGDLAWVRLFGGPKGDSGSAVTTDSEGNVYAAGRSCGPEFAGVPVPTCGSVVVLEADAAGNLKWVRTFGGGSDDANTPRASLAMSSSGSLYVVGDTTVGSAQPPVAGESDVLVAKMSAGGDIEWQRLIGSRGADRGVAVTDGDNGGARTSSGYAVSCSRAAPGSRRRCQRMPSQS